MENCNSPELDKLRLKLYKSVKGLNWIEEEHLRGLFRFVEGWPIARQTSAC